MEQVDAVLEMAPPSSATYVLRLLAHATDPEQVAKENSDALNDEFFEAVKVVLRSPEFKAATTPSGPINAPQTASGVLAVFDSSWRAAIAVRAAGGQP